MTQLEENALNFVRKMLCLYYEKRDIKGFARGLMPNSSWIGMEKDKICKNYTQYLQEINENVCTELFSIADAWYETLPLSKVVCLVYGGLSISGDEGVVVAREQRLSAICEQTHDGMKLLHFHISSPDYDSLYENLPSQNITNIDNTASKNFVENMPCAMTCCNYDSYFTILNINTGFVKLCGYSKKEIEEYFQNQYINLIHESDKEKTAWKFQKEFVRGKEIELEYRLICKGWHVIWVLERSRMLEDIYGNRMLYSVIIDITERKREREEMSLSLERHQIIINQAEDIIFEWDILKDELLFSNNWEKKFGYKACNNDITHLLPISVNIYNDDKPMFIKIMEDIRAGVPYSETEFRIRRNDGSFVWCRIRATTQYSKDKIAVKAVGVITDIDTEKKHEQSLIEQAQKDALTGLFHKSYIQKYVREHMLCYNHDEKSALLIIDLDRFKSINDNFGHLCGDAVLMDTAAMLKKLFRSTDYIGRVGGDEFLVYMKNVGTKEAVGEKAMEVHKAFESMSAKGTNNFKIQCSIGIAFFPQDANDYTGLYKCADNALYYVKNHGRGSFAFFDSKGKGVSVFADQTDTAIGEDIESQLEGIDEALTQYTFRMLYEAVDILSAVSQLLEIVGRAYEVSRVYIFENTEDDCFCNNTFEWCNDGITPQIDVLQQISYKEDLGGYWNNFDDNGVFYCQDIQKLGKELYDILAPQGIVSILQCAIIDEGKYKGYVGFDECHSNRYWTKHQIRSLSVIANVLSAFLMKLRLKEKLQRIESYK